VHCRLDVHNEYRLLRTISAARSYRVADRERYMRRGSILNGIHSSGKLVTNDRLRAYPLLCVPPVRYLEFQIRARTYPPDDLSNKFEIRVHAYAAYFLFARIFRMLSREDSHRTLHYSRDPRHLRIDSIVRQKPCAARKRPKENGLLSEGDAGGADEADKNGARTFRPNHQFQTLQAVFDVRVRPLPLAIAT